MRVNLYAEELTDRTEIIEKEVDGVMFYGVRLYLGFPFIHREGDDDSSAITFWVPWTNAAGNQPEILEAVLTELVKRCGEIPSG